MTRAIEIRPWPRLLTVDDLAGYLNESRAMTAARADDPTFPRPVPDTHNSRPRWDRVAVDAWVDRLVAGVSPELQARVDEIRNRRHARAAKARSGRRGVVQRSGGSSARASGESRDA